MHMAASPDTLEYSIEAKDETLNPTPHPEGDPQTEGNPHPAGGPTDHLEATLEGDDVICLMRHVMATGASPWHGHHRHPSEKLGSRQYCDKNHCRDCNRKLITVRRLAVEIGGQMLRMWVMLYTTYFSLISFLGMVFSCMLIRLE